MCQSQRMPQFMQSNAEYVEIRANAPCLGVVEMRISGQWLGRYRRGREGVRQDASGPVERKSVPVIPAGEEEIHRLVGVRAQPRTPGNLGDISPVRHSAQNFGLGELYG